MSKEKKQKPENTPEQNLQPVSLSVVYAKEDDALASEVKYSLLPLEKLQRINLHDLSALTEQDELKEDDITVLKNSSLVLILVSPDLMAKDFCYSEEMGILAERARLKQQVLIPVILRPTPFWKELSFGKFEELPKDGDAMSEYEELDRALYDVAKGIKKQIHKIIEKAHEEVSL
jgi:hypothetical protein